MCKGELTKAQKQAEVWQVALLDKRNFFLPCGWMSLIPLCYKKKKHIILTCRLCRWVRCRFGPSPLWSPTRCTISEPGPNTVLVCGVSGAQTFPAGLRRKVSNTSALTCSSWRLFLHFLSESTTESVCMQATRPEWSTYSISVGLYLWKLSDNAVMFPFILSHLSAHH